MGVLQGARLPPLRPGAAPRGPEGVSRAAPSPEKTGPWYPLLRYLSAALELGRLKFSGEVTRYHSALVFLAKLRPNPRPFISTSCAQFPDPSCLC